MFIGVGGQQHIPDDETSIFHGGEGRTIRQDCQHHRRAIEGVGFRIAQRPGVQTLQGGHILGPGEGDDTACLFPTAVGRIGACQEHLIQ